MAAGTYCLLGWERGDMLANWSSDSVSQKGGARSELTLEHVSSAEQEQGKGRGEGGRGRER